MHASCRIYFEIKFVLSSGWLACDWYIEFYVRSRAECRILRRKPLRTRVCHRYFCNQYGHKPFWDALKKVPDNKDVSFVSPLSARLELEFVATTAHPIDRGHIRAVVLVHLLAPPSHPSQRLAIAHPFHGLLDGDRLGQINLCVSFVDHASPGFQRRLPRTVSA